MLKKALEAEVADFVGRHERVVDGEGRRQVVRNGYLPERDVLTGAGPITVQQPRVRDRRAGPSEGREVFTSKLLPPYLRRSKAMDELLPWLYLRGISTSDFPQALEALVGPDAAGMSSSTISRLAASWADDHEAWSRRDLSGKEYVYVWADGIHFNIRLEEDRQCILVLIGATIDGKKELIGLHDGYRESEQSWRELLVELKARGLEKPPRICVGDGGLGLWAALRKVYPSTAEQRCWVHKTGNILNKMPRSVQRRAKPDLHEIWMAETKADAERAFDLFVETYQAKYPKAAACLAKDRDVLLTFYDFPAEHWMHIRTTNPIESTFATVRLRTRRTKGRGSRMATLTMVFRLVQCAQQHWRALNGSKLLDEVIRGVQFVDGLRKDAA